MDNKKTIAHCLRGLPFRPMPFVTDQVVDLEKYKPIVFSFNKDIWRDGWKNSSIYLPYGIGQSKLKCYVNRLTRILSGCPLELHKAVKKTKVNMLHAHFINVALEFLPLKKKYNLPMIVSTYGHDVSRFPKLSDDNLKGTKMLFEEAELFLAMSEDMKRDLLMLGCPSKQIIIHHTGADINRYQYREPATNVGKVIFLCVCNFTPKKGVPVLIEAMEKVYKKHPQVTLKIIGVPKWRGVPIKRQIEKMIMDKGLQNVVDLAGAINYYDLPKKYAEADIFVLSSQTDKEGNKEGIPAVIMEAMATGLPVVSTKHAGIPELVTDGKTGYLVPEGNVNQLAERMCKLLDEKHTWKDMGLAGRKIIEKEFNVEIQKRKLEEIYERVLADLLGREKY